jgi:hypothetical protein
LLFSSLLVYHHRFVVAVVLAVAVVEVEVTIAMLEVVIL